MRGLETGEPRPRQVTWACKGPMTSAQLCPPEGWRVFCPACNSPLRAQLSVPLGGSAHSPGHAVTTHLLGRGRCPCSLKKAEPVTEGAVRLIMAVLPVVATFWAAGGQRLQRAPGLGHACLHLGQRQVSELTEPHSEARPCGSAPSARRQPDSGRTTARMHPAPSPTPASGCKYNRMCSCYTSAARQKMRPSGLTGSLNTSFFCLNFQVPPFRSGSHSQSG